MQLFLMLYPSLILQKALRPILPVLEKLSPAKFHSDKAHETSLSSVETDDVAVLFRYLDGFFLYGFFLSFDDEDLLHHFDPAVRDTSERVPDPDEETPPEQSPGNPEENPVGIPPKAGYSSKDPRSDDEV